MVTEGPLSVSLIRFFDREVRRIAMSMHAAEVRYPSLMRREALETMGYFEAFPGQAIFVAGRGAPLEDGVLSPAICYHAYASLQGQQLKDSPAILTAAGSCYRGEGRRLDAAHGRLWSFTMREIIAIGRGDEVAGVVGRSKSSVVRLLARLAIPARLQPATDPFFEGQSRGRKLVQQLASLKWELTTNHQDTPLALASFNEHRQFFGKCMHIRLPDGSAAFSTCAAFGLERLAMAFLAQHGEDLERWPSSAAKFVVRDALR